MTGKHLLSTVAGAIALLAISVPGGAATAGTCSVEDARAAINQSAPEALCGCTAITRSAVSMLQRRSDFLDILMVYEESCPGLANVLGDLPTASVPGGRSDGSGDDEGRHWSRASGFTAPEATKTQASEPPDDDDYPDDGDDDHDHGDDHGKGKGKGPKAGDDDHGKGKGKGHCNGQGDGDGKGKGKGKGHDDGKPKGKDGDKGKPGDKDDHDHDDHDTDDHDHDDHEHDDT